MPALAAPVSTNPGLHPTLSLTFMIERFAFGIQYLMCHIFTPERTLFKYYYSDLLELLLIEA